MPYDLIFHLFFLALMTVLGLVRVRYWRARRRILGVSRASGSDVMFEVRRLLALIGFLLITAHTMQPSFLRWTEFPLPWVVRALGVPASLAGVALVAWVAGKATSWLQPSHQPTLETTGVFSSVRHPLTSSILVTVIALTLLSANWVVGLLAFGISATLIHRAQREDRELEREFGSTYLQYARRTPAFMPRARSRTAKRSMS